MSPVSNCGVHRSIGMKLTLALSRACLFVLALWLGSSARALPPLEPKLQLVYPAAGQTFKAAEAIEIAAVLAVDSPADWVKVDFYAGQTRIGEVRHVPDPSGVLPKLKVVWRSAPAGVHLLRAEAHHKVLDVLLISESVAIKVHSSDAPIAPKVTLLEPKASARYAVGDTVPMVIETVDPDGYVPYVAYYVDGNKVGEETIQFLIPPKPGQVQQFKWPWHQATAGLHRIAVVVQDDAGNKSEAGVSIQVGETRRLQPLVKAGSTWRYHAKNQDLGDRWTQSGFPDSDWPSGPAQLGFGDKDEATLVPATKPLQSTVYFRHAFEVSSPVNFSSLILRLVRDDGAVVFINGKRVMSDNMPDGPVTFGTLALANGEDENAWHEFRLSPDWLTPGLNILAVEVHQVSLTSSDLSFDLELLGVLESDPTGLPVVSIEATAPNTGEPCPVCRIAPGRFTVRRTGDPKAALVVYLDYSGTAIPGKDYEELAHRVELPAGAASVEFYVGPFDDLLIEGEETVTATLVLPTTDAAPTYRIDPRAGTATVVIHDNESNTPTDTPVVSIRATRAETREPFLCQKEPCPEMPEPASAVLTLSRKASDLSGPLTVALGFSGSAVNGVDYTKLGSEATIPPGKSSVEIWVEALPDSLLENDETVVAQILIPPGLPNFPPPFLVEQGEAKVVIHDFSFSTTPIVSIEASQPKTSEPCPTCLILPGLFKVSRTGDLKQSLIVGLAFSGSALPGLDYEKLPERVMIPEGKPYVELKVLGKMDALTEGVETIVATLRPAPADGSIPQYEIDMKRVSATVSLHDAPDLGLVPVVGVKVSRKEIIECPLAVACKIPPIEITFERSDARLAEPLVIPVQWGGSATWMEDYGLSEFESLPKSIQFAAGSRSTTIRLYSFTDCVIEENETVSVEILPDASMGPIARYEIAPDLAAAKIEILDGSASMSDSLPTIQIRSAANVPELCPPNADCPAIEMILTRNGGDLKRALEVLVQTSGSATPGNDYQAFTKSVVFEPGESTTRLTSMPIDDTLVEGDETIVVSLVCSDSAEPNYLIQGAMAAAKMVILDNESKPAKEAFVTIIEPKSGATFEKPEAIVFRADTLDPMGTLTHLDWYRNDRKIGDSDIVFIRPPDPGMPLQHEFHWKNPPAGEHKVFAVGVDAAQKRVVSQAVLVVVRGANAQPVVTVTAGLAETHEVPPGSKRAVIPATLILKRTGSTDHSLKVRYTVGGSAKNGRDYGFLDGDATIAAGEQERIIYVYPITDEEVEGDEYVEFALKSSDAYSVGAPGAARVVIHDAQQPTEPLVKFLAPQDGAKFQFGQDILLQVQAIDPDGYFGQMDFLANGELLGTDWLVICAGLGCEPKPGTPIRFQFQWKNAKPGEYKVQATTRDSAGKSVLSGTIQVSVGASKAQPILVRQLPQAYQPGKAFGVSLAATLPTDAQGYAVEEYPPKGWIVSSISDGGIWDASKGAIKFGPFLDRQHRVLRYDVLPSKEFASKAMFTGWISVDGKSDRTQGDQTVSVEADVHPADQSPANWSLGSDEVTAYGAAWRSGKSWEVGPNPIPIDYVTRAGALWRGGEAYRVDPLAGPAPLHWVNQSTDGVRTVALDFDLPETDLDKALVWLRGRQSFAVAKLEPLAGSSDAVYALRTLPGDHVHAQAVEAYVPKGVAVADISHDGVYDNVRGIIHWGPFFDQEPRMLSARVQGAIPPQLKAIASFDGHNSSVANTFPSTSADAGPRIVQVRPLVDGTVQLLVVDEGAAGCDVEFSDDLNFWHRVGTMSPGTDCQVHHDSDANESRQRFYRISRRK